jgi:hypothetical protein
VNFGSKVSGKKTRFYFFSLFILDSTGITFFCVFESEIVIFGSNLMHFSIRYTGNQARPFLFLTDFGNFFPYLTIKDIIYISKRNHPTRFVQFTFL